MSSSGDGGEQSLPVPHDPVCEEQEQPKVQEVNKCACGYSPRQSDKFWIEEYQVMHVICYSCGHEWVE